MKDPEIAHHINTFKNIHTIREISWYMVMFSRNFKTIKYKFEDFEDINMLLCNHRSQYYEVIYRNYRN